MALWLSNGSRADFPGGTEQAAQKAKEVAGMNTAEMKGKAEEMKGEAMGKKEEMKGEAMGKKEEMKGEAVGKKEELKSKM